METSCLCKPRLEESTKNGVMINRGDEGGNVESGGPSTAMQSDSRRPREDGIYGCNGEPGGKGASRLIGSPVMGWRNLRNWACRK
jgi:hypothetical protein